MKVKQTLLLTVTILTLADTAFAARKKLPYQDSTQPVDVRVQDLLQRMSIEEKVAQMCQYVGIEHMKQTEKEMTLEEMKKSHAKGFYPNLHSTQVAEMTRQGLIGSFLHVITAKEANHLQSLARQSRLGIPLLIGIDAIHGNGLYEGATIYPSPISQAASFDPAMVEKASWETAQEMRATGSHWAFTPNVEVARDARWGRVGETFGEDPYLVSVMGEATIRGLQQTDYTGKDKVIACAKHLIGGSQPINGRNCAPTDISERTLWETFLPPFKKCVKAGVFTLMPAHNEVNGVPSHSNKYLLTEVLRNSWNFNGFVVSDWMDIERLHEFHQVAQDMKESTFLTLDAGMDMHMHGPGFVEAILQLLKEGRIDEKQINQSASKILEAKFRLGLFEDPFVNESKIQQIVFNRSHQHTALEIARRSIVVLKNERELLPIDKSKYKRIFVTGPNADNETLLGDWAFKQPEENTTTVIKGLKQISPETQFDFMPMGWNLRNMKESEVQEAKVKASQADLNIVVLGDNSMRYQWMEKTSGENMDSYDLMLVGLQQQLIEEIHSTGVPTIVVLVNGRPIATEWIADSIPALVEAWEPGSLGGQAVAEILFGQVNPSAKLPITIPRHAGQIPCYYNRKFSSTWYNYATGKSTPLFDFGFGLSYTSFIFSPIRLNNNRLTDHTPIIATVSITNSGQMTGDEVVQLYIKDLKASVTRPVKELKAFQRVSLMPGESKEVSFDITKEMLDFYDIHMTYGIEKGDFELMIGNSSRDQDLQKVLFSY